MHTICGGTIPITKQVQQKNSLPDIPGKEFDILHYDIIFNQKSVVQRAEFHQYFHQIVLQIISQAAILKILYELFRLFFIVHCRFGLAISKRYIVLQIRQFFRNHLYTACIVTTTTIGKDSNYPVAQLFVLK